MPAFDAQNPSGSPADGLAARARHAEGAQAQDSLAPPAPQPEPPPPKRSSPAKGILIAAVPAALLWWAVFAGLHALFQHKP